MPADTRPIISTVSTSGFIGRTVEMSLLLELINTNSKSISLLSPPMAGASELCRRVFDELFAAGNIIPFYFEIPEKVRTIQETAVNIFNTFTRQLAAYRSRKPELLRFAPTEKEVLGYLSPFDSQSLAPIYEFIDSGDHNNGNVEPLLSVPARLFEKGEKAAVIIDGLHNCDHSAEGKAVKRLLIETFNNAGFAVIFSGRRRSLHGSISGSRIDLKYLGLNDTGKLIENIAANSGVEINDACRDLIGRQCGGRPETINSLINNAAGKGLNLLTFKAVQAIYTEELIDGGIYRIFTKLILDPIEDPIFEQPVIDLFAKLKASTNDKNSIEDLLKALGMKDHAVSQTINLLNTAEIIRSEDGVYVLNSDDIALNDHLWAINKLIRRRETAAYSTRSLAVGEILISLIENAPQKMASHYKELSSLNVKGLMSRFDGRKIPASLIDHAVYSELYKGLHKDKIIKGIEDESLTFELPDIVYSVNAVSIYKPLAEFLEASRGAAAFGFDNGNDPLRQKVAWFAAEIESKLEAGTEAAEFWCDRLETAAIMSGIENFRLWLIAPEGFNKEALELLAARNCIGSNRAQIELLDQYLSEDVDSIEDRPDHESVLQMGEETEIIAANTIEEIAKNYDFSAKAINQMKTAVVEAFINASEHSHSPDRKIHLKVKFDKDKLVITVANRGIRLIDRIPATETEEKRRGWGLKLIRKLMDEVEITPVDDGTKIKMAKYITDIS